MLPSQSFLQLRAGCGGISYCLKTRVDGATTGLCVLELDTGAVRGGGYCSAWLALLVCLAATSTVQGHTHPLLPQRPRNQGLFRTKIDGWNQSAMVLLFSSST